MYLVGLLDQRTFGLSKFRLSIQNQSNNIPFSSNSVKGNICCIVYQIHNQCNYSSYTIQLLLSHIQQLASTSIASLPLMLMLLLLLLFLFFCVINDQFHSPCSLQFNFGLAKVFTVIARLPVTTKTQLHVITKYEAYIVSLSATS